MGYTASQAVNLMHPTSHAGFCQRGVRLTHAERCSWRSCLQCTCVFLAALFCFPFSILRHSKPHSKKINSNRTHKNLPEMYDICHPSYYKIGELGCKDDVKITTAFYVYIELCEERRFWDVEYKYNEQLDLIYLIAKIRKNAESEIYVPWPAKNNITLRNIEQIEEHLKCSYFTLVLKSGESSSIFYRVSEGLAKPASPQTSKELKAKSDKKSELEREIRNNSRNLYELAKTAMETNQNSN